MPALWAAAAAGATSVAVALTGAAPRPTAAGLWDAGPFVGWALPLARSAGHVAAVAAVASLLTVVLAPRSAAPRRLLPLATLTWVAAGGALLLLGLAETVGRPVTEVLRTDLLLFYGRDVPQGAAQVRSVALVAAVGALALVLPRRRGSSLALLALVLVALVPPLLTGHAAGDGDHRLAQAALVVHVLPAVLWAGGLAGLVLLRTSADLTRAVMRFSPLALGCAVAVGLSGGLSALLRLDDVGQLWGTGYGGLVLAKALAFVLLVAAGAWHRQRLLPALRSDEAPAATAAFRRLAAGEVAVMAVTFGCAVALARTPVG